MRELRGLVLLAALTWALVPGAATEPDEHGWLHLIGDDLSSWHPRHDGDHRWQVVEGVLETAGEGIDLVCDEVFWDFELALEFNVPPGSNSGVYLQGRYEIQVDDAHGADPDSHRCGGIYAKIAPSENAARPAGEWQSFYVRFHSARRDARGGVAQKARVTVYHNDVLIIDDAEIDGLTGGALDPQEGRPGPFMLQGNHGPIQYRNIRVRPMWEGDAGWHTLFTGQDLVGWRLRYPKGKDGWRAEDRQLISAPPSTDIVCHGLFQDSDLHVEFLVPPGSNSGIYLQGRYEIQVDDAHGTDPDSHRCGGIYARVAPSQNASRPAGQWQSFDVHFVGARRSATGEILRKAEVTLYHNGVLVIDRVRLDGPTGAALDDREGTPGPILLQGDHGPIRYRNLYIRPC